MIKNDSRKVNKGDTFIAIKGINRDGHDYIDDAIKNGATEIICEHGKGKIVKDTKKYLANYLKDNYKEKIDKLKLIGITGTNGKTTSAYLLYKALNKINKKSAYIGTLGFYMNDIHIKLDNTTPDILQLYNLLVKCSDNDIEYVVMEVSSQALSYKRLEYIEFDYAVFTNLTQDHLDYHKTMDSYAKAKKLLFKKLKKNNCTIINNDDKYKYYYMLDNSITYGFSKSDYQITDYKTSIDGSKFKINDEEYETKLIGKHNIYNILITIIVLKKLGIEYNQIYNIIKDLDHVQGRMDTIKYNNNLIIIDYAHTPDAVFKIINSVKGLGNRIITIVGCGGNRDKLKRPIMGKVASQNSDYVIFTSDNPRLENPEEILKDIVNKLDNNNYEIVINREKAIKKGIQKLKNNDILLILGKGHEDYQIIGKDKIPFSDKETVLKNI